MVNQSVWGYFPWWIYLWSVEVISCAQPFMVYKYISMVSGSSFPQSNQLAYPPTNITMENIHVNRWYRHRCKKVATSTINGPCSIDFNSCQKFRPRPGHLFPADSQVVTGSPTLASWEPEPRVTCGGRPPPSQGCDSSEVQYLAATGDWIWCLSPTPLNNMCSSVGICFIANGKIKLMFQTTNQGCLF